MAAWDPKRELPHSNSQLKKAGDRIRRAAEQGQVPAPADLDLLDDFRAWHYPAIRHAQGRLSRMFQKKLGASPELVEITARPLKTREAIVQKLVREKTRLNRMQDIAGARIVGPHLDVQEAIRKYLLAEFRRCNPVVAKDSRERGDSNGYRAVHLVIRLDGRSVEIQIRTRHQDVWANVVEQIDSVLKSDLKHGRGPADWLEWFQELSDELRKGDLGEPFVAPTSPIDRD